MNLGKILTMLVMILAANWVFADGNQSGTSGVTETCPDFSGNYTGTRTLTYININVDPPAEITTGPGQSPKYKLVQKGCREIDIETIGDGVLFGSGKAVFPIGSLSSSYGSSKYFNMYSGFFIGNQLVIAWADRIPTSDADKETVHLLTLSRNVKGKLIFTHKFSGVSRDERMTETFTEN
jgi:hypothetical protein